MTKHLSVAIANEGSLAASKLDLILPGSAHPAA